MPTYAYQCGACGHEFEQYLKIIDRDMPLSSECPNCGEHEVQRIPSLGLGFTMDKAPPLSGDFKNLLTNIKRKNTTLSNKSTVNDSGF